MKRRSPPGPTPRHRRTLAQPDGACRRAEPVTEFANWSLGSVSCSDLTRGVRAITSTYADCETCMNGTIKRLVSEKGFGFILADDGNEYFFHNSACTQTSFDELREGQAVTFDRGQGAKGPRGENIRPA
jgi:cold shock protein